MSFALRQTTFKRVPLVRYSARTKRENRIQVQLLKDFPEYGARGEIIEVLPGLMRNKLYPNNGACYIIPRLNIGPKIPVVKKVAKPVVVEQAKAEVKPKVEVKNAKRIEPIEISSLLFNNSEISESDKSYSLFNLEVKLDLLELKKDSSSPITKEDIVKSISRTVAVSVPVEDLTILSNGKTVDSIEKVGEYEIKVAKDGLDVVKPLIVS